MSVTGVEAEAGLPTTPAAVTDDLPQAGDGIDAACRGVVSARGVLDQQRHRAREAFDGLAPVLVAGLVGGVPGDVATMHDQALRPHPGGGPQVLAEQLTARYPDAVVGAGNVDAVGRVDVDVHVHGRKRRTKGSGIPTRDNGAVPALGVAQEELDGLGTGGPSHGKRVTLAVMGTDADHGPSLMRPATGSGQERPVCQAQGQPDECRHQAGHDHHPLSAGRRDQLAVQAHQQRGQPGP